jgi:hypothetical protein
MPRVTQDFDFQIHEDEASATSNRPVDEDGAYEDRPCKDEPKNVESSIVEEYGEGATQEDGEGSSDIAETIENDEAETELSVADEQRSELDDSIVSQEEDDDETPAATQIGDDESVSDATSRRESSATDRRTSGRTEALIQAAARAVVARIEEHRRSAEEEHHDGDDSIVSNTTDETYGLEGTELSYTTRSDASPRQSDAYTYSEASPRQSSAHSNSDPASRRDSLGSRSTFTNANVTAAGGTDSPRVSEGHLLPAPGDEIGGDSSSQHEPEDDDVFSDRSPRSSMGSLSSDPERKHRGLDGTLTQATRSPRISEISQYDKDDFVPTVRGAQRMPFRTPADVRAMQMASPPASVYGSPRSSKRPLPTISRLGSPGVSAQYSPKRRSTPPRFKSRKEPAPLVLLHATLLSSRWPWAGVLEAAEGSRLSDAAKTLRDNWRQLQDRIGDTVLERGVLIPHPQNDFEILEERLLDAMELPLRRRARILECGHYLGPSNETTLTEDMDSDDEELDEPGKDSVKKSHWCTTCQHEIKYDSLGPGKVFRVKVYASNGLMKAGAWEACWKEMERIDVEIEPIVEPSLAAELSHLAAEQQRREEEEERMAAQQLSEPHPGSPANHERLNHEDMDDDEIEPRGLGEPEADDHDASMTNHQGSPRLLSSSPSPRAHVESPRVEAERLRRDEEERIREMFGHSPTSHSHFRHSPHASPMRRHPDSFIPRPSPPSPSEQAYERREGRRRSYQSASLPELLLEALKVVIQDLKNLVIASLTFLAMLLALRGGGPREEPHNHFPAAAMNREVPTVVTTVVQPAESVRAASSVVASIVASVASAETSTTAPCEPSSVAEVPEARGEAEGKEAPAEPETETETETVTSREVVRVVETVTETVKVTATATAAGDLEDRPQREEGVDVEAAGEAAVGDKADVVAAEPAAVAAEASEEGVVDGAHVVNERVDEAHDEL